MHFGFIEMNQFDKQIESFSTCRFIESISTGHERERDIEAEIKE